jgi:HD superfamily phosphodiesterase
LSTRLTTSRDGVRFLEKLGATRWLVRHHELVVEAAVVLCDRIARELRVAFDRDAVLLGAALHDAGKIVHPEEMSGPGNQHEAAGRKLLIDHGAPAAVARFCVTHASWDAADCTLEDQLVALADKVWKGKRDHALEQLLVMRIAAATNQEAWAVFDRIDAICESIAAEGPARLARSAL